MADHARTRKLPAGDRPSDAFSNPVLQNIYGRRSTRNYKPDPVPEAVLLEIIKAGIYAPTARNQQVWRFIVVTDKAEIDRYADRAKRLWQQNIALNAPKGYRLMATIVFGYPTNDMQKAP